MPTSTAATASSRVIAGPTVRSRRAGAGPCVEQRSGAPGEGRGHADVDDHDVGADLRGRSALTTAPPARKFATIWAVTSCGHGVTPWACTPWSPAKIATAAGDGTGGGQSPASPASWTDESSSTPSEPAGLVSRACRSRAAAIAAASSGRTAAMRPPSAAEILSTGRDGRGHGHAPRWDASRWAGLGEGGEEGVRGGGVADGDAEAVGAQAGEGVAAAHRETLVAQGRAASGCAVRRIDGPSSTNELRGLAASATRARRPAASSRWARSAASATAIARSAATALAVSSTPRAAASAGVETGHSGCDVLPAGRPGPARPSR